MRACTRTHTYTRSGRVKHPPIARRPNTNARGVRALARLKNYAYAVCCRLKLRRINWRSKQDWHMNLLQVCVCVSEATAQVCDIMLHFLINC